MSAFPEFRAAAFPYRFACELLVEDIAGGVPLDPRVAEGWIKSKLAPTDDRLREMVAETMVERGVSVDEAAALVEQNRTVVGFKRDFEHGLYVEGRQVKAAIKEAAMVAANAGKLRTKKWGNPDNDNYKKGLKGWLPEHVFVPERRIYLGVTEPSRVDQRFVHGQHGASISNQEVVAEAKLAFTVETDHDFTPAEWAAIWLTGERQGLGATRSQGYGRYTVVSWERIG